jgi:hypothetical protein
MHLPDLLDQAELRQLDVLALALPKDSNTAGFTTAEQLLAHVVKPAVTRHGPVGAYLSEFIKYTSARVPYRLEPDITAAHQRAISGARSEAQRLSAQAERENDLRVEKGKAQAEFLSEIARWLAEAMAAKRAKDAEEREAEASLPIRRARMAGEGLELISAFRAFVDDWNSHRGRDLPSMAGDGRRALEQFERELTRYTPQGEIGKRLAEVEAA